MYTRQQLNAEEYETILKNLEFQIKFWEEQTPKYEEMKMYGVSSYCEGVGSGMRMALTLLKTGSTNL